MEQHRKDYHSQVDIYKSKTWLDMNNGQVEEARYIN